MKIYLIGLPGCGKSTLGKQLSQKLNIPFIDLDAQIEKEERMLIKEIFKLRGESTFRKIESHLLKKISEENEQFVMATGGGAPVFFDNMEAGRVLFWEIRTSSNVWGAE